MLAFLLCLTKHTGEVKEGRSGQAWTSTSLRLSGLEHYTFSEQTCYNVRLAEANGSVDATMYLL